MKEQSKKTHFHEFSQEINSVFFDFDQKNMSPVGAMELKSFHKNRFGTQMQLRSERLTLEIFRKIMVKRTKKDFYEKQVN